MLRVNEKQAELFFKHLGAAMETLAAQMREKLQKFD